jgi:phosphatidylglycerophosphatase A
VSPSATPRELGAATQIATLFGVGSWPIAPGTWASLIAGALAFAAHQLTQALYLAACAATFVVGLWAARAAERVLGKHDDGRIVIDEVLGTLCALLWIDRSDWQLVALGVAVFRVLDIVKPWPIAWVERRVTGGLGVLLDDLVAGLATSGLLATLVHLR